jgi:hypothetical protein
VKLEAGGEFGAVDEEIDGEAAFHGMVVKHRRKRQSIAPHRPSRRTRQPRVVRL